MDNLKIFKKYFLGQNAFADDCEIENEEILEFNWTNSYTLVASAKSPLMIRNDALGYQIRCILAYFSLDTKYEKWSWAVKPEFKLLSTSDTDMINSWNENRKQAFFGSITHFLLSLSRKNLHDDSFCAYFVDNPGRRSARIESVHMSEPYENLFYYGETPEQSILNFKDCLCIVYNISDVSWLQLKLDEVIIDKCLELKVIAREVGCSLKDLQFLNPELLRRYTPPNMKRYKLKLPVGKKDKFLAAYDAMPSPKETSWVRHKIRKGEAVSTIEVRIGRVGERAV